MLYSAAAAADYTAFEYDHAGVYVFGGAVSSIASGSYDNALVNGLWRLSLSAAYPTAAFWQRLSTLQSPPMRHSHTFVTQMDQVCTQGRWDDGTQGRRAHRSRPKEETECHVTCTLTFLWFVHHSEQGIFDCEFGFDSHEWSCSHTHGYTHTH